jgi:plasmid stabilization system protein ParE
MASHRWKVCVSQSSFALKLVKKQPRLSIEWYAERSETVAKRFSDELLQTVEAIAAEPQRFPIYKAKYRYRLLRRFPYRVIYRER